MNADLTKRLQRAFSLTQQIQNLEAELTTLMGGGESKPEPKPKKKYVVKQKPYNDPLQVRDAILRVIDRVELAATPYIGKALADNDMKLKNQAVAQFLRRMCDDKILVRTESGNYKRFYPQMGGLVGSATAREIPGFTRVERPDALPSGFHAHGV
jgi:hypothetical protein